MRRGFALVAVLVVMGSALLVATGLIFLIQAEVAGSAGAVDTVQSRALAWSGLQVIMGRLNEQRESILAGRAAELAERYAIYDLEEATGVVELRAIGPGGERLVPEAGKLDLNSIDAEGMVATGFADDTQAQAIVSHRELLGRPFQSVAELLDVEGVSAETLYGPIDELAGGDPLGGDPLGGDPLEASIGAGPRGLADVVTVYSFEPALQLNGRLRINLNVEWSEELADRVSRRFGRDAAEMLGRIIAGGTTFDSEARIFEVLRFFDVEPEQWPEIIDAFTTESGELHFGRLDINTAPYECLVAVPGIEPDAASAIVRTREDLSDDERGTIAWPAIAGIVEPAAYSDLAGRITTRCWAYRVRIAAGTRDPEDAEAPLRDAVVYEAVIDLSAPRPRLAYLREMTLFETVAQIASNVPVEPDDGPPGAPAEIVETARGLDEAPTAAPGETAAEARTRRVGRWLEGR